MIGQGRAGQGGAWWGVVSMSQRTFCMPHMKSTNPQRCVYRAMGSMCYVGVCHAQSDGSSTHLGIVSDKEGKAGSVGDKVLQGGQGNGQAIMGGGAPPQLIHNHQRACSCTCKDVACLTQLLHHHQSFSCSSHQGSAISWCHVTHLLGSSTCYHAGQGTGGVSHAQPYSCS